MTPQELKEIILGDSLATSLATAGNYTECATRCELIAPPRIVEKFVGELGVFSLYESPVQAEAVIQKIENVALVNPVVKRLLKWIQPGAPGINFGDLRVRYMLTLPIEQGGVGLTNEEALPLLRSAEVQRNITVDMIAKAWRE
jgi:hypothetical protein